MPTAAPAVNGNKRSEPNTDTAASQRASKMAKQGAGHGPSHAASAPATNAAVATGVGYGDETSASGMRLFTMLMNNMLGNMPMPHSGAQNPSAATKSAVASGVGYGGGHRNPYAHTNQSYLHRKWHAKEQQMQQDKKQQSVKQQQGIIQNEKAACVHAILRLLRASYINPITVCVTMSKISCV